MKRRATKKTVDGFVKHVDQEYYCKLCFYERLFAFELQELLRDIDTQGSLVL